MPSNVPKGTIMSGGAGGTSPGSESVMCKAFNEAVEAWCDPEREKGKGKTFNDYYFDALKGQGDAGKALVADITREAPILVNARTARTLEAAGQLSGSAGKAARGLAKSLDGLRAMAELGEKSWSAFRWESLIASWRAKGLRGRLRFPDGMMPDGTPIEIKGPGDTPRKNQFRDYKRASPNGEAMEISCESCGNDCASGNKCPPKKKK